MNFSINLVAQIAGLVIQYGNLTVDVVPAKYKAYVSLVVGIAQAVVAWKAHFSNPDGTPAATEYKPKQ